MDGMSVSAVMKADFNVQPTDNNSGNDLAQEMKSIRKARLNRQVFEDPSLAGKLVATKASPMYNASGDLIQALSSNLGSV